MMTTSWNDDAHKTDEEEEKEKKKDSERENPFGRQRFEA